MVCHGPQGLLRTAGLAPSLLATGTPRDRGVRTTARAPRSIHRYPVHYIPRSRSTYSPLARSATGRLRIRLRDLDRDAHRGALLEAAEEGPGESRALVVLTGVVFTAGRGLATCRGGDCWGWADEGGAGFDDACQNGRF